MAPLLPAANAAAETRGRWYDRLGAAVASLCAVHCAVLPLAMVFLPALGLDFLASHAFEGFFLAFTTLFATLSVGHSLRAHGRFYAWRFLLPGLALLWLERFFPAIHEHAILHATVMTLAGTLVAVAHVLNLRLAHVRCPHGSGGGATLPPLSDPPSEHSGVSHG